MSVSPLASPPLLGARRWFSDLTDARLRELVYRLIWLLWFTLPWEGVIRIGGTATLARAVGAVLFVVAVFALVRTGRRVRANDFVVVLLCFAGWAALSSYWSVTPGQSQQRLVTLAQLIVMVLITWEFAQSAERVRGLMSAWLAGCVVVAGIIVVSWALGQSETRYFAPGTHPGDQAYALLVGIPMAWYLAFRTHRSTLRMLYRLFVPFACLAAVLTASRAALISLIFALLIIPLTVRALPPRHRIGVGLVSLVVVAGAVVFVATGSEVVQRLGTTSSELSSGTLDHRTTLWSIALQLIGEHPLVGTGVGGSRFAVSAAFSSDRVLHDTYLSLAVELGLVGLALFLLAGLAAAYRALTRLGWLDTRLAWSLTIIFAVSLVPRTDVYNKSTYALLTLLALLGCTMPARRSGRPVGVR